jgi:outer membrane protein assembly factor BamB
MTDAELLALIRDRNPDDLTADECAALQEGSRRSPLVMRAVRECIDLEQRLAHGLGQPNISVERILARAGAENGRYGGLAFLFAALLSLLGAGGAVVWVARRPADVRPAEIAVRPADQAVAEATVALQSDSQSAAAEVTVEPPVEPQPVVAVADPAVAADAGAADATPLNAQAPEAAPTVAAAGTAEEPPQAAAEPTAPWEVADERSPPGLFESPSPATAPPTAEALQHWFALVPGKAGEIGTEPRESLQLGKLFRVEPLAGDQRGWFRLQAPLDVDSALPAAVGAAPKGGNRANTKNRKTTLRMALVPIVPQSAPLWIHAWSGKEGVSLYSYGVNGPWAAYRTTRVGKEPHPSGFVLVARDQDRMARTNPGTTMVFDLRWDDGLLTLSRGDVRILDVPLAAAPHDVYFEGQALVRDLEMVPSPPLPAPPQPATRDKTPASVDISIEPGGTGKWVLRSASPSQPVPAPGDVNPVVGGSLQQSPQGGVQFVADKNPQPVWATIPVPPGGPREVVLQIDAWDPLTGVVLAGADGTPQRTFVVLPNQLNKNVRQLELMPPGDARIEATALPYQSPIAGVGSRGWLKFVQCGGMLRCAISADGRGWTEACAPLVGAPVFRAIGLHAQAQAATRSITLGALQSHPFEMLQSLAPANVPAPTGELPGAVALPAWRAAALAVKPAEIAEGDWVRACALRQLGGECSRDLAVDLLDMLGKEGLSRPLSLDDHLRLLDEIATLAPVWDAPVQASRVAALYADLGRMLADRGAPHPYSTVARHQQTCPLLCSSPFPFFPQWLARGELLDAYVAGRWAEMDEVTARVRFFGFPTTPFLDWAFKIAQTRLGSQDAPAGATQPHLQADWRQPLIAEPDKEAATIAADFRTALVENDIRHASESIVSAATDRQAGLVAAAGDSDLLVRLSTLMEDAIRTQPQVAEMMRAEFGQRGGLRLRQAIDTGDVAMLEALAAQYPGTEAAAEARLLLGDRCLAAGDIGGARRFYGQARFGIAATLRERLDAAEQLAAALQGDVAAADPVAGAVAIGAARVDAGQWQKLVADLRTARATAATGGRNLPTVVDRLPAPRTYEPMPRQRLEGDVGQNPTVIHVDYQNAGLLPPPNPATPPNPAQPAYAIDWVARQAALVAAGPRLLASNRFQLASYDAQSGQLQWRAGLGAEAGPTHAWAGQPMRPALSSTHAFVRRLRGTGPLLAAIRLTDGAVTWERKTGADVSFVASDPVLVNRTLYACTATRTSDGHSLALASFSAADGALIDERPLTQLHGPWLTSQSVDCQLVPVGDAFVVSCGAGVACCDRGGATRWLRLEPWVPYSVDPLWLLQAQVPPLVWRDRLFVVQPAVPGVIALDAASGRALWRRGFAGVRRVVGLANAAARPLVVVERETGLAALDAESGETVWHADLPDQLDGCLVSGGDGVWAACQEPVPNEAARQPVLVWLDGATGAVRHRTPLPQLKDVLPRLGPFLPVGDRVWTLFGRGPTEPSRDLVELLPK